MPSPWASKILAGIVTFLIQLTTDNYSAPQQLGATVNMFLQILQVLTGSAYQLTIKDGKASSRQDCGLLVSSEK
jgi:hypothetical protein